MFFLFLMNGRIYTRNHIKYILNSYDEVVEQLAKSGNSYFINECKKYAEGWNKLNIMLGEKERQIIQLDEQVRILQNRLAQYGLPFELNAPGGERAALNVPASSYDIMKDSAAETSGRNSKGQFVKKTRKKPHEGSSVAASKASSTAGLMYRQGYSISQIANKLKVSEDTVKRYIRKYKEERNEEPIIINSWDQDGIEAQVDYVNGIQKETQIVV